MRRFIPTFLGGDASQGGSSGPLTSDAMEVVIAKVEREVERGDLTAWEQGDVMDFNELVRLSMS